MLLRLKHASPCLDCLPTLLTYFALLQVIWQLDSGHKTFLPRLGGGLTSISRSLVDAACYVVSQADNTVRMVSTH